MPLQTRLRQELLIFAIVAPGALVTTLAATRSDTDDYQAANERAMVTMMKAMDVEPTQNVDLDFATMMIPHHQGAVEMALAELRYGRNEQPRRLAHEIVVTQSQEISIMRLAIDDELRAQRPHSRE